MIALENRCSCPALCQCDCPAPNAQGDVQCSHVGCIYHLAVDVSNTGTLSSPAHPRLGLKIHSKAEPSAKDWIEGVVEWMLITPQHCALAAARQGPRLLQQIGDMIGVTRERARQIEGQAIKTLLGDDVVRAVGLARDHDHATFEAQIIRRRKKAS